MQGNVSKLKNPKPMIPTFKNLIENQQFKIQKANESFTEFMIDCNSNVIEIFFED